MALVISLALVPLIRRMAIKAGMYDAPGERKIHKTLIPRLGGIAIFCGFIFSLAILVGADAKLEISQALMGTLAGSAIIFALGLADDLKNISPYIKLAIQFVAALTAFFMGVEVATLDLPQSKLLMLHALSLPVTVVWIVSLSNAMNFIDGLDGLAGGVTVISALTLAVIASFTHQPMEALLAATLAGAALGFLAYNFHPAKIFMGDSGALFCGFMLACISVTGVFKTKVVVMLLPLFILIVPILDINYSIFRRLLQGKNPFLPDASHIHHQFINSGMSQVKAVTYLYIMCIMGGIVATGYVNYVVYYVTILLAVSCLGALLVNIVRRFYPVVESATIADDDRMPESIL